jgi:hypothetical protein
MENMKKLFVMTLLFYLGVSTEVFSQGCAGEASLSINNTNIVQGYVWPIACNSIELYSVFDQEDCFIILSTVNIRVYKNGNLLNYSLNGGPSDYTESNSGLEYMSGNPNPISMYVTVAIDPNSTNFGPGSYYINATYNYISVNDGSTYYASINSPAGNVSTYPTSAFTCGNYTTSSNVYATDMVYSGGSLYGNCSSGFTYLAPGSNTAILAGNNIQFLPGFLAASGSTMLATIGGSCLTGNARLISTTRASVPIVDSSVVVNNPTVIYPNPSTGLFNISYSYPEKVSDIDIQVIDMLGQKVFDQKLAQTQTGQTNVDLSNQPNGIYLVQIKGGTNITTQKVVVAK